MKQRTAEQTAALDAAITRGIVENKTVPEVAERVGIPTSYCYTIMQRRLGVEKVLLLPEERAMVETARRGRRMKAVRT